MKSDLFKLTIIIMILSFAVSANAQRRNMPDPEKRFKLIDKNSDGRITEKEFITAHKEMKNRGRRVRNPETAFREIDANNDKIIDKKEFMAYHEKRRKNRPGRGFGR